MKDQLLEGLAVCSDCSELSAIYSRIMFRDVGWVGESTSECPQTTKELVVLTMDEVAFGSLAATIGQRMFPRITGAPSRMYLT